MILPRKFHIFLAKLIGYLFLNSSNKRNKYSKINIELCFPELSQNQRDYIYKKNIISSGSIIFDTGSAWFWSDSRINKSIPYKINGLNDLISQQKQNNGVLLFFKHSLHLELDARILGMHSEIYGVERKHNSKYFQSVQKKGRLKSMKGVIDRNHVLKFIKLLKSGKTVLYAPDQDYGIKKSLEVNFFSRPAATVKAPLKIVQNTKCQTFFLNTYIDDGVLILDIERLKLNESSTIKFLDDLNTHIENKIRKSPHEYLWQHRRFKSNSNKVNLYK
tara:strand:+ start:3434 stop:4258 length:825 start_codon:yes stop_codon:yes gene_type:complete